MDKILVVIKNLDLRYLYQELLLSKKYEVIPLDSIPNTLMLLAINHVKAILFYDDVRGLRTFLSLRKRRKNWLTIKIILLTTEENLYSHWLMPNDLIFNPHKASPGDIIGKIRL